MGYKTKTCFVCGKEYRPNSGHQKYCIGCMGEAKHAKTVKWHAANLPRDAKRKRESYAANPEKERARKIVLRKANPHQWAQTVMDYRKANPAKMKVINKKHEAKRRALGFVPLNTPFDGCEAHHIDKNHVLYIPQVLHKSVPHDIWTGRNMGQINALAQQWTQTMEA
jgi:hypothetical protein